MKKMTLSFDGKTSENSWYCTRLYAFYTVLIKYQAHCTAIMRYRYLIYIWFLFFISRYIHAVVVPLLIFLFHKDLRKKAEIILCCWRPNSVEGGKKSSTAARQERPISGKGAFTNYVYKIWLFLTTYPPPFTFSMV